MDNKQFVDLYVKFRIDFSKIKRITYPELMDKYIRPFISQGNFNLSQFVIIENFLKKKNLSIIDKIKGLTDSMDLLFKIFTSEDIFNNGRLANFEPDRKFIEYLYREKIIKDNKYFFILFKIENLETFKLIIDFNPRITLLEIFKLMLRSKQYNDKVIHDAIIYLIDKNNIEKPTMLEINALKNIMKELPDDVIYKITKKIPYNIRLKHNMFSFEEIIKNLKKFNTETVFKILKQRNKISDKLFEKIFNVFKNDPNIVELLYKTDLDREFILNNIDKFIEANIIEKIVETQKIDIDVLEEILKKYDNKENIIEMYLKSPKSNIKEKLKIIDKFNLDINHYISDLAAQHKNDLKFEMIEKYIPNFGKISWFNIIKNIEIPEDKIEKYVTKDLLYFVARFQKNLSFDFIKKHANDFGGKNLYILYSNKVITFKQLEQLKNELDPEELKELNTLIKEGKRNK